MKIPNIDIQRQIMNITQVSHAQRSIFHKTVIFGGCVPQFWNYARQSRCSVAVISKEWAAPIFGRVPHLLLFTILLFSQIGIRQTLMPLPVYAADCAANLATMRDLMNHYNVITIDDLSTTSDIEGRTFVGGDLISQNSATFATRLRKLDPAESTLDIVGDIVAGNPLNLNAGSLHLGGERNGRIINFNGGGQLVQDALLTKLDVAAMLNAASTDLAALTPNNNASIPSGQPGPLRFTVADKQSTDAAIFHVDAADIFENRFVQQIELQPYRAETIVINVAGTKIDWRHGNMIGNFVNKNWQGNLIWNFYEATSIDLDGKNFMGALLAPLADVTTTGPIDGSVAAHTLTTRAAVRQPEYTGNPSIACATPTADLYVVKSSNPDPVVAGMPLIYTIVVTNYGPDSAENVVVIDSLPDNVTFRRADDSCHFQQDTVTCTQTIIPANWTTVFTIEVDVHATSAE